MTMPQTDASNTAQRLQHLQQELAKERERTQRAGVLTAVIGGLLVALIAFYFYNGYRMLAGATEPVFIADATEELIDRNLPEVRQAITTELKKSAPIWAARLSTQVKAQLPAARVQTEEYIGAQINRALGESSVITETEFRRVLKANHDKLEKVFKDLANGPTQGEASIKDIEETLSEAMQADLRAHARGVLVTLSNLNDKLRRLRDNKGLNPIEQKERQIIALARRMHADYLSGIDETEMPIKMKSVKGGAAAATQEAVKDEPSHPTAQPDKKAITAEKS